MPAKGKAAGGKKTTATSAKKKNTAKAAPKKAAANSNARGAKGKPAPRVDYAAEIFGLVLAVLGLFLFFTIITDLTGVVGEALRPVLFALFGVTAYVIPFGLMALGVVAIMSGFKEIRFLSVLAYVGLFFCISCIIGLASNAHYDTSSYIGYIRSAYSHSLGYPRSAGAVSAALIYPVQKFLGTVGGYLVFSAIFIIIVVSKFHFSLRRTGNKLAETGERVARAGSRAVRSAGEAIEQRRREAVRPRPSAILRSTRLEETEDGFPRYEEDEDDVDILSPVAFNDALADGEMTPDFLRVQGMEPAPAAMEVHPPWEDMPAQEDPQTPVAGDTLAFEPVSPAMQEAPRTVEAARPAPSRPPVELPAAPPPAQAEAEHGDIAIYDETTEQNPDDREIMNLVAPDVDQQAARPRPAYKLPKISLLDEPERTKARISKEEYYKGAHQLEEILLSFGVKCQVVNVSVGPAITRYELQPAPGVKIARIVSLSNDIALGMAAEGIRLEAPIPGKAAIGVEVPNAKRSMVKLREVLEDEAFRTATSPLTFGLGKDIAGKAVVADIAKMPHTLIAGATGSGKSVCINSLIVSILFRATPQQVRMIMIDPKVVELRPYNGIPHLLIPVVTDPKKAAGALNWAVQEMGRRYNLFSETGARDIARYNEIAQRDPQMEQLPLIVIIIDELADLMMVAPNDVEDSICRLAQLARAAGMHLVVATQRPSVDVITGIIKANIPSRIAFAVSSQVDSRTIIDKMGAEKLLGRGDMLFDPSGAAKPVRIQGSYVDDDEVERIVEYVKSQVGEGEYDQDIQDIVERFEFSSGKGKGRKAGGEEEDLVSKVLDPLLGDAVDVIFETGQASASMLQRRLRLGYARASRLVDELEQLGILGPSMGSKPREMLVGRMEAHERVDENGL